MSNIAGHVCEVLRGCIVLRYWGYWSCGGGTDRWLGYLSPRRCWRQGRVCSCMDPYCAMKGRAEPCGSSARSGVSGRSVLRVYDGGLVVRAADQRHRAEPTTNTVSSSPGWEGQAGKCAALFCPCKPTELAIFRKTPNAKSKCGCMHALAGGILTVSSPNRRSTSISRALSAASSSDQSSDELAALSARGLGTLADASTTPTIQIASHPHRLEWTSQPQAGRTGRHGPQWSKGASTEWQGALR